MRTKLRVDTRHKRQISTADFMLSEKLLSEPMWRDTWREEEKAMSTKTKPQEQKQRPLTPYERNVADRILMRDGFPDEYVTDETRLQVLKQRGLRK